MLPQSAWVASWSGCFSPSARASGELAKAFADRRLARRPRRGGAQVELRGEPVHVAVDRLVVQLDEALLEVVGEAGLRGGDEHAGGGEHARLLADVHVAVHAVRRARRAVAVLVPVRPQPGIAGGGGPQAAIREGSVE